MNSEGTGGPRLGNSAYCPENIRVVAVNTQENKNIKLLECQRDKTYGLLSRQHTQSNKVLK